MEKEFVLSYDALEKLKKHGKTMAEIDTNDIMDLTLLYYSCATYETTLTEVLARIYAEDIPITLAELIDDLVQTGKKKEVTKPAKVKKRFWHN